MPTRAPSLLLRVLLVLSGLVALGGCAATGESDLELASDGLRPSAASGKADGVGPEAYFAQFRYAIDESAGTYDSGEPRRTYMASTWGPGLPLETASGTVTTKLELWMLDDGTAYASYSEWERASGGSVLVAERILRTTWRVVGDEIAVVGVGTGVAAEYDGFPAISMTYGQDLISAGLAGRSELVVRVRTSSRLAHVEADYAAQGG